jgi:hypothetical protein
MTLDKRAYLPGSRMTLTVANVSGEMASLRAAVTIAHTEEMELHESLASHRLEAEGENIVTFAAPPEHGAYEARLFTRSSPMNSGSLILRVPFEVADTEDGTPISGRWDSFGEHPGAGWEFAAEARDDWN